MREILALANRHEKVEEKFRACYPNWLHKFIMDETKNTDDYLIFEHAVNQAWRHRTDLAEINTRELGKHYELAPRKVHAELRKLIELGKLIPTDYKADSPDAEFRVPLITSILNKYKRYGVKI